VTLFKENGIFNNKISYQYYLRKKDGWYSPQEFQDLFEKERNRSDRSGLPLSYVYIDMSKHKNEIKISYKEYSGFLKTLLNLISENTRNFDMKTLIDPYKIGILLVDTSLDGAKTFIEKISSIIFEYFNSQSRTEYIEIIKSIIISSYPVYQIQDCYHLKGVPLILNELKFKKNNKPNNQLLIKDESKLFINWYRLTSMNGAIALSVPLFEGIELLKKVKINYEIYKRLIDITGSLFGIIFFSPLMLVIAILIKITSNGPVFFKQKRIGRFGKIFTFLKFRTMLVNCDDSIHKDYVKKLIQGKNNEVNLGTTEKPLYKIENDPRITWLGRYLRKLSLDELPQFFNVLVGSMSLVGPRPPIPYELESYKSWHHRRILEVKPGITGLWQVYGRSMTTFDEMVRLDLQYVHERSLKLDIKILFKTILVVFNTKGAL